MKRIFGMLSLMAIMMVAFTPQAIAFDTDYQTEFVVTTDHYDFVAVESVNFASIFGVINVADEPVSYLSMEGFILTNIVSRDLYSQYNFETDFSKLLLPVEVGLNDTTFNTKDTNFVAFSDLPFEVGWKL